MFTKSIIRIHEKEMIKNGGQKIHTIFQFARVSFAKNSTEQLTVKFENR